MKLKRGRTRSRHLQTLPTLFNQLSISISLKCSRDCLPCQRWTDKPLQEVLKKEVLLLLMFFFLTRVGNHGTPHYLARQTMHTMYTCRKNSKHVIHFKMIISHNKTNKSVARICIYHIKVGQIIINGSMR